MLEYVEKELDIKLSEQEINQILEEIERQLFVWTYIPAIISFFEALVFWFSSEESFDRKYNS